MSSSETENAQDHSDAYTDTGFWGRRAAGSIINSMSTGRFLLALRSDAVLEPNTWGTWGGACDKGETPEQAAMREATEENGVDPEVIIDLIPSFVFRHESGFEYHNFIAVVQDEYEPVLDWETSDFAWMELQELPDNLHPGLVAFLQSDIAYAQVTELQNIQAQASRPQRAPGL